MISIRAREQDFIIWGEELKRRLKKVYKLDLLIISNYSTN